MTITILKTDGTTKTLLVSNHSEVIKTIEREINAGILDSFGMRNQNKRVWVDDLGHQKHLPINKTATEMYHSICVPGTTQVIRGDVAITPYDW